MEKFKIFIVEDDETIASLIKESLERWGFEARCCEDFSRVTEEFVNFAPQLAVLDISLPFYNGYYWCAEIRKLSEAPIVFLSSHSESMDLIMAVNMGGDDYICKPFSMDVLIAKINAALRRAYSYASLKAEALGARGALFSASAGTLSFEGKTAQLTKNEIKILATLLEKKNSIVSRDDIMKALWDCESFVDDNTLTVNINRLRVKLDELGLEGFISTKKGMGYAIYD
ncbi:MAG: response regulator transcription factor [Oscillospiraceae bacterium]|nr:response regulator transcription factor [Oscillospiraceae bacterium]